MHLISLVMHRMVLSLGKDFHLVIRWKRHIRELVC